MILCKKKIRLISIMLSVALLMSAFVFISSAKALDGNQTTTIIGDADANGDVNIADATKIQKVMAGLDQLPTGVAEYIVDVNNDKNMDIKDATMIQKYIARIIDSFTQTNPTYNISYDLNSDMVELSNDEAKAYAGSSYSTEITLSSNATPTGTGTIYRLATVIVTMGEQDITTSVVSMKNDEKATISIGEISGNVAIKVTLSKTYYDDTAPTIPSTDYTTDTTAIETTEHIYG